MAGQHLKDKPRKSKEPAAAHATAIADLLVRYQVAGLTNWRLQDGIWQEIRKALEKYKIAVERERTEERPDLRRDDGRDGDRTLDGSTPAARRAD